VTTYYAQHLSGERLARCYELAAPRMQRYLECEIRSLLQRLQPGDRVLELGCGYGRVALRLAQAKSSDWASMHSQRQRSASPACAVRCRASARLAHG
jgi:SAM-dependent methyltransferase